MKVIKAALLASTLVGGATSALAATEGELLIWIGTGKAEKQLQAVADRFTEELGIPATVEVVDPDLAEKFQRAASTGDGPDIVLWPHDRFGEWAVSGLIQAVEPSQSFQDGILATAWDAVTLDGKIWGYPVAIEAVGLIYNKDLISQPPQNFEDMAGLELPEGVSPILWDYTNAYFTMPLLMANGGFAFEKVEGVYDGTTTGVNNEGALKGAAVLVKMIEDETLPLGVDYGVMDGAMARGQTAMVINGPWSWKAYEDAGINIGVAPIPHVNGKASPPYLGVYSAAVNTATPNKDLVTEFVENYMLSDEGLAVWNEGAALGALADISSGAASDDPKTRATLENAAIGVPMPSNPEMGAFWAAMGPALGNITSGKQTAREALDDAAARILGE